MVRLVVWYVPTKERQYVIASKFPYKVEFRMEFSHLVLNGCTVKSMAESTISNWGKNLVLKSRRCTFERAEKFISKLYFSDINLQSR
jgi:hypothetical protein